LLSGKYKLGAEIGSGGMSRVFRALCVATGEVVAVKVLRPELVQHEVACARFVREGRSASMLRHPNVTETIDVGTADGGTPYLVMELLEGETLAHYAEMNGGVLKLEPFLEFVCPILEAVEEAHRRGIVHRDLKPENIFLATIGPRVIPKLLDFGISRIGTDEQRVTTTGVTLGTPAYMAPEQVISAQHADARSDIWSLGVMMYELLSGQLPFEGESSGATYIAIATRDPKRLADLAFHIPAPIGQVVHRCIQREPNDRYESVGDLLQDLRIAAKGGAIRKKLVTTPDLELGPRSGSMSSLRAVGHASLPASGAHPAALRSSAPDIEKTSSVRLAVSPQFDSGRQAQAPAGRQVGSGIDLELTAPMRSVVAPRVVRVHRDAVLAGAGRSYGGQPEQRTRAPLTTSIPAALVAVATAALCVYRLQTPLGSVTTEALRDFVRDPLPGAVLAIIATTLGLFGLGTVALGIRGKRSSVWIGGGGVLWTAACLGLTAGPMPEAVRTVPVGLGVVCIALALAALSSARDQWQRGWLRRVTTLVAAGLGAGLCFFVGVELFVAATHTLQATARAATGSG
jgi:serine/threonine protein kinase